MASQKVVCRPSNFQNRGDRCTKNSFLMAGLILIIIIASLNPLSGQSQSEKKVKLVTQNSMHWSN